MLTYVPTLSKEIPNPNSFISARPHSLYSWNEKRPQAQGSEQGRQGHSLSLGQRPEKINIQQLNKMAEQILGQSRRLV